MGKQSSCGADAAAFPPCRLTRALCNQPPAAPVDWAGLLVNLRGMSNRDGMAQSAGKPTLPPDRAAGATLEGAPRGRSQSSGGTLGGRPVVAFCRRTSIARSQALEITQLQGSPPTTQNSPMDSESAPGTHPSGRDVEARQHPLRRKIKGRSTLLIIE
jgi:hypothetical protein